MRPYPCSVSLSLLGGMLLAWLTATWMHTAAATSFVAPQAVCVLSDRGVLRAWSCRPDEAESAIASAAEQNRMRTALGGRLCWWHMSEADFQTLPGVGPATAVHLLALVEAGQPPSLLQLHRVPRIGSATAMRVLATTTTACDRP